MPQDQKTFIPYITWDENHNVYVKKVSYEDISPYLTVKSVKPPAIIFDETRLMEIFEEVRREKSITDGSKNTVDVSVIEGESDTNSGSRSTSFL